MMTNVLEQLKGRLIVSCQAAPGDPLEDVEALRRVALSVMEGGASGLRLNSALQVAAVRRETNLPIIGIEKKYGPAGLRITPDFASAAALVDAGASMVALDCTDREWPGAEPWRELIQRIHLILHIPVMADISTAGEAEAAAAAGADCVGTTLYGYTERSGHHRSFSWQLLAEMRRRLGVPIMAEGHIVSPEDARRAVDRGAWSVIVGSAITRPGVITAKFAKALGGASCPAPAIGIDIGGTSIKAGLVQPNGEVCFSTQVSTQATKGRNAVAAGLVRAVEDTFRAAREQEIEPSGIGIATAGAVNEHDGSIFAATDNLPGWAGFELRTFAQKQFQLPVSVVNDAQAAALSELHFGMGRGLSDFVVITLGTGVGGGIVSGGKLIRGQHGFAGSIGHTVIQADGRSCNCGRRGCLEAFVSTAALLRAYREPGQAGPEDSEGDAKFVLEINQLARDGDAGAQRAFASLADHLSQAVADLFNLFDPQFVFLSGGLIEGYPRFLADVQDRVSRLLHFGAQRQPQLRTATTGRFAGVQGAASLVLKPGY